jgi:hypothetical protein
MKTFYKILPWALLIVVCFLFWKSCQNNKGKDDIITVTVPEQKGKFDALKPEQNILSTEPTSVLNSLNTYALSEASKQTYEKDLLIYKLIRQNDSLSKAFSAIKNDSVKIAAYNAAIAIREYKHTFEDTAVKIDLSGLVRGEIQSMQCDWKVKERKLPIQVKTWRILGGVELGAKHTFEQFGAKANLRYQSAKGNQYSLGYDNNQMIWFGHDIQIFKRTKVK